MPDELHDDGARQGSLPLPCVNDWLAERAFPQLTPEQYAQDLAKFLEDHLPECDGISFDIEGLRTGIGIKEGMSQAERDQVLAWKDARLKALAMTLSLQEKAIAYAKSVIPMDHFQVGIKTIPGKKDIVDPRTGLKGPRYGGLITDASVVRAQCEKLLRPSGVGLALFPTSAGFYAGLNEKAPLASTYGNPAQAPMSTEALDRVRPYSQILPKTSPIASQAAPIPSQKAPIPSQTTP